MKRPTIIVVRHHGIPFEPNKNAILLVTGRLHHYVLLRGGK